MRRLTRRLSPAALLRSPQTPTIEIKKDASPAGSRKGSLAPGAPGSRRGSLIPPEEQPRRASILLPDDVSTKALADLMTQAGLTWGRRQDAAAVAREEATGGEGRDSTDTDDTGRDMKE